MYDTLQPVNPDQQVTDQSQPVDQSQPGSAAYMNSEAANPIMPTVQQSPNTLQPGSAEYMNSEAANPYNDHLTNFVNNQHEPAALLTAKPPEHLAPIFKLRAGENLNNDMEKQKAVNNIQQMDPNQLANALKEKTTGGSWTKAIIYGVLGMENSAQAEAAKLGVGKYQTVQGQDGQSYLVKTAANGTPLEGFSAATGNKLNPNELINVVGQGSALKGQQTHTGKMQDIKTGEVYYEQTSPQGIKLVDTNGKRYSGPTSNLRPFGIGSDISTQNVLQLQKLQNELAYAPAKERANVVAKHEATYGQLPENIRNLALSGQPLAGVVGAVGQFQQPQLQQPQLQQPQPQQPQPVQRGPLPTSNIPSAMPQGMPTLPATNAQGKVIAPVNPAISVQPSSGVGLGGNTPAAVTANLDLAKKQQEENINIAGKRSESFNKHIDETITPEAVNGDTVSSLRKQQFNLFNRPDVDPSKIFGIANGVGQIPGDQRWTMFRDVLLGKVSEPADEIRQRAAQLGLNPSEQSAVAEYAIANAEINAKTLKSTAGAGSVSDAEQAANRQRNIDVTKVPMLGGYNAMAQSQFNADLAKYKGDWSVNSKASNTAQLESEWRKEKQKLTNSYIDIAKQRLDYISKNGNSSAAIKQGYTFYPVPTYDNVTNTWSIKKPLSEILGK